jgi:hypothetical protein
MSKTKRGNYHFLKPSSPIKGVYELIVRQHPGNSRLSLPSEKSGERKTIEPAVIVELKISDEEEQPLQQDFAHFHYNPFLFAYVMLIDARTNEEVHFLPGESTRVLTGSIASCIYHLKDPENDNAFGAFFVFPDVSVRQEGEFRLKISLFKIYR